MGKDMTDEEFFEKAKEVTDHIKKCKREGKPDQYLDKLKFIASELMIEITSRKQDNMRFVIDCRYENNPFGI